MELHDIGHSGTTTFQHYRILAASESKYESAVGEMVLELLDRLRNHVIGVTLGTMVMLRELWLQYADGNGHNILIRVTVDHKDHSALIGGIPRLHYRLAAEKPRDNQLSFELRTHDVDEVCEFIVTAINNCMGQE
jgi:hypothetical protein